VILLRFNGEVRDSWRANVESCSDKIIVLRAISTKRVDFASFTIEQGEQVRQYFLLKDWFYIQEYSDSTGRLKGWYCNIGTPPVVKNPTITIRDLILDILVSADLSYEVLDEDELEEKRVLMPATTLRKINEAREKLVQMVEGRKPPFNHDGEHPNNRAELR
jgi:protein associated with RNAse G/E